MTRYVGVGSVWGSKMATYTPTGATVRFFTETSLPFFVLPGSKISQVYIIFQTHLQILVATPTTYTLHVDTPLCNLYNLHSTSTGEQPASRCISCIATHAIFVACQKDFHVNIHYKQKRKRKRKQLYEYARRTRTIVFFSFSFSLSAN